MNQTTKTGEMKMTPNDIEVLLHAYVQPFLPHPRNDAVAVKQALRMLVNSGVLQASEAGKDCFEVTEQGTVLVEMLCSTPFPIKHTEWRDPRNI
jgi:hypothetical protein